MMVVDFYKTVPQLGIELSHCGSTVGGVLMRYLASRRDVAALRESTCKVTCVADAKLFKHWI